jgi:HAD superfamily hydrolase (TIGR01509 family)
LLVVTETLPAAVLWDMDGTLVDTEPYWIRAETTLIESWGGTWTHEEALALVGQGLEYSAQVIQAKGVRLTAEEIVQDQSGRVLAQVRESIPWRPGAQELLASVRAAGIPTALVTMSRRMVADFVASQMDRGFDVIVGGEDVTNAKPHPEAYLRATELLGVDPFACVAIEDSRPGLASAVAAGTAAIGVPHVVQLEPSSAYTLWPTLLGRTVSDLSEVLMVRARP